MKIFKPYYYDSFRCLAEKCPDSCCKEWDVEIDPQSATYYRCLSGPLGERLRQVMREDPQWGTVMTIENGRCPMWREDVLCQIQAELGHDGLCKTCRDFPRISHDYGDFREWSLELSCPEAARLILSAESRAFYTEDAPTIEAPEYDKEAMAVLLESRKFALDLLENNAYTIPQALTLLLYYGYHIQALLDGAENTDFNAEAALQSAKDFALSGGEADLLSFFTTLEILTPQWQARLIQPLSPAPWQNTFRNLACYFVERYWLQAVSDYDLLSRVKFTVVSCLVVRLLGGDLLSTAQLYAKEIENSTENVDTLLDATYSHPALTDRKLLGMLKSLK